jgi:hypothetical protein
MTAEEVRNISEKVYRARLGDDDVRRMIENDDDGGAKLRARAGFYDPLTRVYVEVLTAATPT